MPNVMTQVKFTIESDIVSVFKARCAAEGVSMTSLIRDFMRSCQPSNDAGVKTLTRPQRKKAVLYAIDLLNEIVLNEEGYRDAIPEQFAQRYDTADHTCECLFEAIEHLEAAYD